MFLALNKCFRFVVLLSFWTKQLVLKLRCTLRVNVKSSDRVAALNRAFKIWQAERHKHKNRNLERPESKVISVHVWVWCTMCKEQPVPVCMCGVFCFSYSTGSLHFSDCITHWNTLHMEISSFGLISCKNIIVVIRTYRRPFWGCLESHSDLSRLGLRWSQLKALNAIAMGMRTLWLRGSVQGSRPINMNVWCFWQLYYCRNLLWSQSSPRGNNYDSQISMVNTDSRCPPPAPKKNNNKKQNMLNDEDGKNKLFSDYTS